MKSDNERPEIVFRKVQLDINFGDWGPDLLELLDPKEIVGKWKKTGVQTATVPAKNHWGYTFYKTNVGTIHPALEVDLLDAFLKEGQQHGPGEVQRLSFLGWQESVGLEQDDVVQEGVEKAQCR